MNKNINKNLRKATHQQQQFTHTKTRFHHKRRPHRSKELSIRHNKNIPARMTHQIRNSFCSINQQQTNNKYKEMRYNHQTERTKILMRSLPHLAITRNMTKGKLRTTTTLQFVVRKFLNFHPFKKVRFAEYNSTTSTYCHNKNNTTIK